MDKSQIRAFLEHAPFAVAMFDRDMRYISASRRWLVDYGLVGPLEGRSHYEIYPDAPEHFRAIHRRALAGETLEAEADRILHADGSVQWLRWRICPWRGPAGEVAGVIVFSQDISELKDADEAARRNRLRLQLALDAASMISFDWDIQRDEIQRFQCADLGGRPQRDGPARTIETVLAGVHDDDKERFIANLHAALTSETGRYESEVRVKRPCGGMSWSLERGRVERDESGEPVRLIGVAQDITERKAAEQALSDASRRRDEFLAILSHELRNPLAPIRNAVHVLKRRESALSMPDSDTRRLIDILERQTDHLIRLVDDLLEVSRITAGKIELRKTLVDLGEVVRQALQTSAPVIDQAGHRLTVSVDERPMIVEGDSVRLVQALANLLINAAKYTPPGGRIDLAARRNADVCEISVRDNGIGITAEMLPRVFDLFTQSPSAELHTQGGVGVGLALVRNLVEMHGGTIEGSSEGQGCGAEFIMRLPLLAVSPRISERIVESAVSRPREVQRVLVVDDAPEVADILVMLLESLGAEARAVYSGAAALEVFSAFRPDVAFIDIGMPEMDGCETARKIRQTPGGDKVALAALTGWGREEDRKSAAQAGFDRHFVKPIRVEQIEAMLAAKRAVRPESRSREELGAV
ncbi:hybrid sensor histidine kinase/response regulator [Methylocystis heyeri]|uniref:histidine kinase n=1 Tax=Methylocystis heyeri TaxID=391905 RepID=A0A6B8KC41_9HYPH|nr:ATP-binding protein [Methylocystis heyeri]QGM45776.1 PAS domain-containing protein [Methylocystis heyeri]